MNIEDVKVGTRVVCVECKDDVIPVGAVGTVIENDTTIPWVSFDENYEGEQKEVFGHPNCKVMELDELKVLKENTSEGASSKETNLGKLTVSLATEDTNSIAKDILNIVLKDLNVIITDAIDSLSNDNEEFKQPVDVPTVASNIDLSEEKLQSMFEEVMKDVMKEYLRDSINTLNKTAFGI